MNSVELEGAATKRQNPQQDNANQKLVGHMGVLQLAFTVIAYNAPIVVFVGYLPAVILLGNGVGTPAALLACGVVVCLLVSGILLLARRIDSPGGFYSFVAAGLGKEMGLGAGFAALTCYYAAMLGGYALGGIAMNSLVHDVFNGPNIHWWVFTIVILGFASVIGYFNIDVSAKVLTCFLALEVGLIAWYDIAVIAHQGLAAFKLNSFDPSNVWSGSIGIAVLFGVGCYGGFEATVVFRNEVRDPVKTVRRATYLVIACVGFLYAFTSWMFINSYGGNAILAAVGADPTGAATSSVEKYAGHVAFDIVTLLTVTGSFALIVAAHNISARYLFNLSADGVLPRVLSEVHHKHRSPARASVGISLLSATGILVLILSNSNPSYLYAKLAGTYAYTAIILLLLVAIAIVAYVVRTYGTVDDGSTGTAQAIGSTIAAVVMVWALWIGSKHFDLLTGATGTAAVIMFIVIWGMLAAGIVTAVVLRKSRPETYERIGRQEG
ncbi:APC family permease [Rhodococcus sp. NPDC057014]|uniref:APC family permease n=1 Tax=Rhodococcus sp. NPDC057014 TaxID=3346000 RepID=UPI00362E7347